MLAQYLPSLEEPLLIKNWNKQYINGDTGQVKQNYMILYNEYKQTLEERDNAKKKLVESQSTWTLFAQDILAIAKGLFKIIKAIKKGQNIPEAILQNSWEQINKFDSLLNDNHEIFDTPDLKKDIPSDKPFEPKKILSKETSNFGLDYEKIKQFLLTSTFDYKVCAVLQALRWRIMRCTKRSTRMEVISELIKSDIMGCQTEHGLLNHLLCHKNKK